MSVSSCAPYCKQGMTVLAVSVESGLAELITACSFQLCKMLHCVVLATVSILYAKILHMSHIICAIKLN